MPVTSVDWSTALLQVAFNMFNTVKTIHWPVSVILRHFTDIIIVQMKVLCVHFAVWNWNSLILRDTLTYIRIQAKMDAIVVRAIFSSNVQNKFSYGDRIVCLDYSLELLTPVPNNATPVTFTMKKRPVLFFEKKTGYVWNVYISAYIHLYLHYM